MKLMADVITAMIHNYPVLEAIVVLPLLLKKYLWVFLACVGVAMLTFGVERHNIYTSANLLSYASLVFFTVQVAITAAITALLFALKTVMFRAFKISGAGRSRAA